MENRLLVGTSAGKTVGLMSSENKAKIAEGAKRRKIGHVEDVAHGVRVGIAAGAAVVAAEPFAEAVPGLDDEGEDLHEREDIDGVLAADLDAVTLLSTEPTIKKGRGRSGGRGRGRGGFVGPAAAENTAIDALAAAAAADEEKGSGEEEE